MILVCDLGNTNIVFGLYENNEKLLSFRLVSSNLMDLDEYVAKINNIINDKKIDVSKVRGAIMSSVMPSIAKTIKRAIEIVFNIDVIVFGSKVTLNCLIRPIPEGMG